MFHSLRLLESSEWSLSALLDEGVIAERLGVTRTLNASNPGEFHQMVRVFSGSEKKNLIHGWRNDQLRDCLMASSGNKNAAVVTTFFID